MAHTATTPEALALRALIASRRVEFQTLLAKYEATSPLTDHVRAGQFPVKA